jgi:hypothetical protein
MKPPARGRFFIQLLSIGGLVLLSYVLGAAVMHFKLPTSAFLADAFLGGQACFEKQEAQIALWAEEPPPLSHDVDEPARTFDGYTLYTTNLRPRAVLLNMAGAVVHTWEAPFRRVWPQPPHVSAPVGDAKIYLFGCCLYPNGDLLALYHGTGDTPYGYGLAKLDRDANVVWTYSANAHHGVDVGEDGTIYVLTHQMVRDLKQGETNIGTSFLADYLVLLSPDGQERKKISLIDAFRTSPYAALLPRYNVIGTMNWDILHANAVEVLSGRQAPHFPRFRTGQVLVSLRETDVLAVLDVESNAVVWAARGPWRHQHDPHFLDNGRLLVFDNLGFAGQSRVLEYDPQTQACPWGFGQEDNVPFVSPIQGRCQRLPNGNTLIVNSRDGMLLEVTQDRQLVWSCSCHAHVPFARRYDPQQLTFLKGAAHARP